MSKVQFGVLAGLLVVLALLQLLPIVVPDRVSPQWDYRIEGIKDEDFITKMNSIGNGGWELVFARRALAGEGDDRHGAYEVIFKKPR